jgi:hypothetical protein
MDLLARALRPSGPTHGRPPLFLSVESRRCGTHGTKPHQQSLSAWQASFNPSQSDLPTFGEVAECSGRLRITCECYLALVEC